MYGQNVTKGIFTGEVFGYLTVLNQLQNGKDDCVW
jgi:hypothetical protein